MREDKEIATQLRKNGKSYREIRAQLKIPLATLSDWFSEIKWSKDIAKKLAETAQSQSIIRIVELNKIRGATLARVYKEARKEAAKELNELKYNPLFIAGLMLYWGEGTKNPKDGVKLTNTDPHMIRLYVFFLRRVCRIPLNKIKAHILIYPDLQENICRSYWSKMSGLPIGNFTKSVVIQGRHQKRRLNWGVCTITVSSFYFKEKMLEWLRLLPKELMDQTYYENIVRTADMV